MSFIVLSFYLLIINITAQKSLNPIYEIQNQLEKLEINLTYKNNNFLLEENNIRIYNKEMAELKEIYELMRKIDLIKNTFEKENYLKKHS